MTFEIFFVLAILAISLVLFITEALRMDVVALLVLGCLAVGGLVTTEEALAGFSNPAVVTVWAMFILSAGLSATGVADAIGRQVLKLAGDTEPRMIIAIMLTAGGLSAFMNNIGVAALMLPVVMDIARKTHTPPARLLMPMAYGSLLGGLTTLIGTPPNLVASTALQEAGHTGFELFTFAPIGVPAMIVGTLFVAFIGRHLLPGKSSDILEGPGTEESPGFQFAHGLEERRFRIRVAEGSPLDGMALSKTALGPVLGLNVVAVERRGSTETAIDGDFALASGDILLVQGRLSEFEDFLSWQTLEVAGGEDMMAILASEKVGVVMVVVAEGGDLVGMTVSECSFNDRFGAHILAVRRGDKAIRDGLPSLELHAGDIITVNGLMGDLEKLESNPEFSEVRFLSEEQLSDVYPKSDRLLELAIPEHSKFSGRPISECGLAECFHLRVIGIVRRTGLVYLPGGDEKLQPGDRLLVHGRKSSLEQIRALQSLGLEDGGDISLPKNGGGQVYTEVTLAPGSSLVGANLRELNFRHRYGLSVLSIWRGGRSFRSHLRNMRLEFGDALLLSGPSEKVEALTKDSDFLILTRSAYEDTAREAPGRAILAAGLMLAVVVPVLMGWLPIAIAAVAGGAVMVAARCLSMEEAYRAIEWKSVFLIAGMLPLGTAMQTSGAALWIAEGVSAAVAPFGIPGVLIGLYLLTAMCTTIVPTTALVLIMAPIAIQMSATLEIPPQMLIMAIAMAASASFTSPISHPANVLVMGPGGYRFLDYVKLGVPLAIIIMLTVLPLIWWFY